MPVPVLIHPIVEKARSDPIGAGIVVCAALIAVLTAGSLMPALDVELPRWKWPQLLAAPRVAKPLRRPPPEWLAKARPGDVLRVPGFRVDYWGDPKASYGKNATAAAQKPVAIVVHFTDDRPILDLVRYQHEGDHQRGGAYGYHVYIDSAGRIVQGAPMSARTNHIKPPDSRQRTSTAAGISNANTISVSLVGACRSPRLSPITYQCSSETVTDDQREAGLAVVAELRRLHGIPCGAIYGHGDLQHDRKSFEGMTLSRAVRAGCS